MSAIDLLARLRASGIHVAVDGDRLRVRGSEAALTAELRAELTRLKPDILALLRGGTTEGDAAIPRAPRSGRYPLSFAQQRLWLLHQLDPASPAYNIAAAIRLRGALSVPALEQSINEVVRRHDVLRTAFVADGGEPAQVVRPALTIPLRQIDFQHVEPAQQEAAVRRFARDEAEKPFALAEPPLIRTMLLRLAPDDHVLLFTGHHIISDGWSAALFTREIGASYEAIVSGRTPELPALPIQYGDFAVWQRERLSGARLDEQLGYWRRQLAGLEPLQLTTDRPRTDAPWFRGGRERLQLSPAIGEGIRELGRRHGATPFMILLAAWNVLLHRYTGQHDLVVGSAIANRTRAEIEPLIGFFVNALVTRTDVSGDPTFVELLGRVRDVALGAFAHQDVPFEKVVEDLQPERRLAENPLFQVIFAVQNAPATEAALTNLHVEPFELDVTTTRFDLEVYVRERAGTWAVELLFREDLFEAATVRRMLRHYEGILESVVARADRAISAIPMASSDDRRLVIDEWNATSAPYPSDRTVHEVFADRARTTPDAVAVSFGGAPLTYGELDRRANQLARRLRGLGVGPNVLVGLAAERSLDMVVGLLAILKAGGAYVPLESTYPRERLALMLNDIAAPVLLTQAHLIERLPLDAAPATRVLRLDADWAEIAAESDAAIASTSTTDDLAYVTYTSGSTGVPKGVEVRHRGVLRLLFGVDYIRFGADQTFLQLAPVAFDASTLEIWGALLHGGRCALYPGAVPTTAELGQVLAGEGVTTLWLTASLFNAIVDESPEILRPVRQLLTGGEALSVDHVRRALAALPGTTIVNGYGPTESTTFTCCYPIPRDLPADAPSVSIGRPIANTRVYVLDAALNPQPPGVPGELYIGGDGLARGYLRRPELTAERFIPDPFRQGGRLYKTGDVVRWLPDGRLAFIGRLDGQVKIRGFRIELGEIESTLRRHPAVRNAAVVAREDEPGDRRLVAYVVTQPVERAANSSALEADRVAQWQKVYDTVIYDEVRGGARGGDEDPTFNIAGWNSTYTGQPIPAEAMREQVEQTVARIAARRPRRILEIGCGTGLLLFRLVRDCERYCATDFSAVALDYVAARLPEDVRGRVDLRQRMADDFSGLEPGSFDAVILNSVVQYFPGWDYLLRVVEGAVRVLAPGGAVFVGDVRSHALMETFHTAVQVFQAPPDSAAGQVRARIAQHIAQEQELLVSPRFFAAAARRIPGVTHASVQPKRGRHVHELTEFRYDATLEVGGRAAAPPSVSPLDWNAGGLTIQRLREMLGGSRDAILLRNVPNARVAAHVETVRRLAAADDAASIETVRAGHTAGGVDPEDLWALGPELGCEVELSWLAGRSDGTFDAFIRPRGAAAEAPVGFEADAEREEASFGAFANEPVAGTLARGVVPQLRQHLAETLPEYMMPSAFVQLDALPLTPNGKIDARRLPRPETLRTLGQSVAVPPRSPVEEALADIWCDVLRIERPSVHDNFFEAGGHSLLATQVVSRVRSMFGIDLPLRALFEAPTIAGLARMVEAVRHAGGAAAAPIVPRPRGARAPLSFAQQRLWFLEQLGSGSAYHTPVALRLQGPLDRGALERAVNEIIRRHDTLRTTFHQSGGEPYQLVQPALSIPLPLDDVSGLSADARESLLMDEMNRPFDLTAGPLVRARLFQAAPDDHLFALTFHHIVADGWSLGVLARELTALYGSFVSGETPSLPPLQIQYADFAAWQRETLQGDTLEGHLAYWREQLAGLTPLQMPTDRPRPPLPSYKGAVHIERLPAGLAAAVQRMCRERGVTPFMVFLAGFQLLLARYSGQEDVAVGSPIANRNREEIEDLLGFFVNTLVLRTDLSGNPTFEQLVDRVRHAALDAYAHQDLPFEKLVDELQPDRDLTRNPLFQVSFAVQNLPLGDLRLGPLAISPVRARRTVSRFDLELHIWESGGAFDAVYIYSSDLFDAGTIERIASHFARLMESAAAAPAAPVADLRMLSAEDEQRIVTEWNDTARRYDAPALLHELIEAQIDRTPDAVAVMYGGERLTFADLDRRANQLARRLRALGAGPESLVGVCMERSLDLVVALVGVLKAGAAYVPLDPGYPAERLAFMTADARPSVIVTHEQVRDRVPLVGAPLLSTDGDAARIAAESADRLRVAVTPGNLAYMIYTSGSTGTPKGAMNAHRGICNRLLWMQEQYGLTPADRVLQKTPFSFDVSVWEFFWPLMTGAPLVVARPGGHQDPAYLAEIIRSAGVTTLHFVPSMLRAFLDEPSAARCSGVRRVICSGEALPFDLQQRFFATLNAELHNLYGPTEAAVDVTYWACVRDDARSIVPIGRPVANTQTYVVDRNLRPVPPGVLGELYLGGVQVGRGYWNRPALTAERFVPDPFSTVPGARLYRTGDLARYLDDGSVHYAGRTDHQVKVRGFRIELGEIEAVLTSHPAIAEAAVIARERTAGDTRLVAYIAECGGEPVPVRELRAYLGERLPDYMVPSLFVRLAALPLSPSGKLDRRALPDEEPPAETRAAIVPPRTGVESVVAGIWADVLGRDGFGVEDDFFELGGHSLLATQVVSRLRDTFAIELPLRRMFEARTVEQIAALVEDLVAEQIDAMSEEDAARLVGGAAANAQESK